MIIIKILKYSDQYFQNILETEIKTIKIETFLSGMNMAEVEVFGLSKSVGFVTGGSFMPSEGPAPTIEPYTNEAIINNEPPVLQKNLEG